MENANTKGILVVVSGFSGAGKGTIIKELLKKYENFSLSISATTRAPRAGEVDGSEYFFLTKEEFEKGIAEDAFIEYANYVGNFYGTPRKFVLSKLDEGQDVLLEIEIQGALEVKKKYPQALLVFLTTPDAASLKTRLESRGTEDASRIMARLQRAKQESRVISHYDYVIVNDSLDKAVDELYKIVESHHMKDFDDENIKHLKISENSSMIYRLQKDMEETF